MASSLAPLCPTCLERALAWTATKCPTCEKSAALAACDRCLKTRAGLFVPAAGFKEQEGPQEPFVCRDCMEEVLEDAADARCQEAILMVAAVLFSVFWWKWMPAWGAEVAFALALIAIVRWVLAVGQRNKPAKSRGRALKLFAAQIVKAKQSRAKALR